MITKRKKPKFNVLNYGFMKSVKKSWRKPRGTHNKKRMKRAFTGALPKIGYGNAADVRCLREDGRKEMLVCNLSELEAAKGFAVRIASSVGMKKRLEMKKRADALGLDIVNFSVREKPKEGKADKQSQKAAVPTGAKPAQNPAAKPVAAAATKPLPAMRK